jgi:hypothetical protein
LTTLAEAVHRGVDVRVLFDERYAPGPVESDDVAYLRARNVACRAYPLVARMHSRVIVVDGEHVICGSHGWSPTSMYHSDELSFYVRSSTLAGQQASRFESLWSAAEPDGRFDLGFFRLWPEDTREKLLRAGIRDPRRLCAVEAVSGLAPAELQLLQREVRLVVDQRLPLSVARRLARLGVDDAAAVANLEVGGTDADPIGGAGIDGSDLAPLRPFLDRYRSARNHDGRAEARS